MFFEGTPLKEVLFSNKNKKKYFSPLIEFINEILKFLRNFYYNHR